MPIMSCTPHTFIEDKANFVIIRTFDLNLSCIVIIADVFKNNTTKF